MEYKVDNAELTATLTAVNLDAAVIGQTALEVAIGESARIDVGTAVNYIKSGEAEIDAYINDVSKPQIVSYIEDVAEPLAEQIVSEKAEPLINTYVSTSVLPNINDVVSGKINEFNDNAVTQTELFDDNAATAIAQATASATNAANNAQLAMDWATKASIPVEGDLYSAKYYANKAGLSAGVSANCANDADNYAEYAATSATAAEQYKRSAAASATTAANEANLAEQWAVKMDGKIDNVDYSAKYYAAQAEEAAASVGNPANRDLSNLTATGEAKFTAKQDVISDLSTIRSGAAAGATAVQPADLAPYALSANLATVATSGSYNDLSNKPTIPAAQVNSDWNASSGVAQILNKPSIPTDTADLTNGAGYITSSALANYVDTSTAQTIGGVKTFTSTISGSINGNAATVTNGVYTDTNQTISGQKTFTSKLNTAPIELYPVSGSTVTYIDFHYNGSSSDYTSRIIENASGELTVNASKVFAPASDADGSILTTVAKSKAANGYFQLGNGLIINWGAITFSDSSNTGSATFSKPFTTSPKIMITRISGDTTANDGGDYYTRKITTTGFEIYRTSTNTGACMWIAIGY